MRYKQPVSVLVIVYTPDLEVLLIERSASRCEMISNELGNVVLRGNGGTVP